MQFYISADTKENSLCFFWWICSASHNQNCRDCRTTANQNSYVFIINLQLNRHPHNFSIHLLHPTSRWNTRQPLFTWPLSSVPLWGKRDASYPRPACRNRYRKDRSDKQHAKPQMILCYYVVNQKTLHDIIPMWFKSLNR